MHPKIVKRYSFPSGSDENLTMKGCEKTAFRSILEFFENLFMDNHLK